MKIGTRLVTMAGAIALGLTAGAGAAMAHGGGHGRQMWLLAHAAGITRQQISSAFENDASLATDRTNLHSARDAMMTCVVSGGSCSNEISAYSSALQTVAQEKLTVWQNLFKQAPNTSQATTVLGELRQLHATRKQIFQQAFGARNGSQSSTSGSSPAASSSPSGE
jgi:hypothetical protein